MLRRGTFQYTVQARCPLPVAAALLTDPSRQVALHPFMVRARSRPPRRGALRSYEIADRLPVGPLRVPTRYRADLLVATDDEVVIVAWQWPRTTVRNHTRLRAEPQGLVRIDVEITLTTPGSFFGYAFRQAHAAHLTLAARLGAVLDTPAT